MNIALNSYNEIFTNDEKNSDEEIKLVPILKLKEYAEQPFKVLMDASMDELVESIKENGVLNPIIARPYPPEGYEILSGHRRVKACEIAGITEAPVIVKELDDDTAAILLVDSNLQRENILPSEKAAAYALKLEAMKRKAGRPKNNNCTQVGYNLDGKKSTDILADEVGESRNQIQRYIRLNNLISALLDMVDEKKIALNAAVELSYLGSLEQANVLQAIEEEETAPSIAQATKMHKFSKEKKLDFETIYDIMREEKTEKFKVTFKEDKLRKYFPKDYTAKQIEKFILQMLETWSQTQSAEM